MSLKEEIIKIIEKYKNQEKNHISIKDVQTELLANAIRFKKEDMIKILKQLSLSYVEEDAEGNLIDIPAIIRYYSRDYPNDELEKQIGINITYEIQ